MKKIFTLFAILFTMVGSMMASAGDPDEQRTVAIPSEFNGWYVYSYVTTEENSVNYRNRNQAEVMAELSSLLDDYYIGYDDITLLNDPVWSPTNHDAVADLLFVAQGQVVNGQWTVPMVHDPKFSSGLIDPLYYYGMAFLFVSSNDPVVATEWAILRSTSQQDVDYTNLSTHLFARGIMGGKVLDANKDPQSDYYYTTYYDGIHDFNVMTPGVEVYTVSLNNDYAVLNAFTDEVIPADLPVLMKSNASKIIVARDEAWTATTDVATIDNALAAPLEYVQNVSYTLAAEGGILGFYRCTRPTEEFPEDKACLNLPVDAPAPHRIAFASQIATGLDADAAAIRAEKFVRDGQLMIRKNGHCYNAHGVILR